MGAERFQNRKLYFQLNLKDVNRFGIRVATLCPSFADTDILNEALLKSVVHERPDKVLMPVPEESLEKLKSSVSALSVMK